MKSKASFIDPKTVYLSMPNGEKFIVGFHSSMNYCWEDQCDIHFLDFLAALFDKFYKGDDSVIHGEIFRQLLLHGFESINSFHKDRVSHRVLMGERIRQIREKKGISALDLSFKCGLLPKNIERIEAGRYAADLDVLANIAEGLGMKIDFVEVEE